MHLPDLTVKMYVKLIKVLYINVHIFFFFNIESDYTEEWQWKMPGEMPISSFLDNRWLLYTQPLMSEGNIAHMDGNLRFCLERVKIVKNGML